MALSFSNVEQQSLGSLRGVTGTITFGVSYAGPGEPFTPSDIGLGEIISISFNQVEDGFSFHWDKANNVIRAFQPDGTDAAQREVTGGANLGGVVVEFIASGR